MVAVPPMRGTSTPIPVLSHSLSPSIPRWDDHEAANHTAPKGAILFSLCECVESKDGSRTPFKLLDATHVCVQAAFGTSTSKEWHGVR